MGIEYLGSISDFVMRIYDALDVGIFITDSNCKVISINQQFEKITSITREELLGKNVQYLLDKGYIANSVCIAVAAEGKPVTDILQYKNAKRDVIVTGKPVFADNGELKFIVCTMRDWNLLTEIHKELQTVKIQSERYQEQLQNLALQHLEDSEFIAKDPNTKKMLQLAARIAKGNSTVLLLGESGVGKDMLARFIHKYSPRFPEGSFVHVNCGAIPDSLFESEFFGYSPGAFTGASKSGKPGLIEIANNGTLFLDEIAELPMFMQAKLLKVLQERTITRVGSTNEKKVDIRVIAATNKKLESLVDSGQFRQDLYYRLNVFEITVPALRQRKDDIPPLISLFLTRANEKYHQHKAMSAEVVEALVNYSWPGNARELENTIERLVVLCQDDVIKPAHLPEVILGNMLVTQAVGLSDVLPLRTIVERLEKAVILESISKSETLQAAADQLGIDVSTLTRKKQKYGIFKKKCSLA